jgi:heme-degrading monooxygenase HmoA
VVIEYIRYTIPEGRREEFESAYARAQESLRVSPHCLGWEIARGVEEPAHYVVRIRWDSVEGHERGFRTSPEFQAFLREVRPFFGNIEEMKHYDVTTVEGERA